MTSYFLILLTLISAIVGTLWDASRRTKLTLVAIATLSGLGSAVLEYQNAQDQALNQRLIIGLVQSLETDPVYAEEIRNATNMLFETEQKQVSGLIFSSSGLLIQMASAFDAVPAGVLFLSQKDLRPIRYSLVAETDLAAELSAKAVQDVWTTATLVTDWNRIAPEIAEIMAHGADVIFPDDGARRFEFNDGNSVTVERYSPTNDALLNITMSSLEIQKLVGLNPVERGNVIMELAATRFIEAQ